MNVRLPLLCTLAAVASGCVDPFPGEPEDYEYRAVIRWTEYGIPHILADDIPSAMYGKGYAFAKLNGCILADQIVKVRSERSKYFGPGDNDANIDSDAVMLHRELTTHAEKAAEVAPDEILESIDAYAAGYNEFITTRADELPCGAEPWLVPISRLDLLAYYIEIAGLASARQLQDFMLAAVPPSSGLEKDDEHPPRATPDLSTLAEIELGSNGWGIGGDRTVSGGGMVLANPHFPWQGELKLYESHIRVEGEVDVYGASLMGVAPVLIGFNKGMAWTHTVSAGNRFTAYRLTLNPDNPFEYLYDGSYRPIEASTYTIEVLGEDGELSEVQRTMYRSHYGPIIAPVSNGLPWTPDTVYTFRDANSNNYALIRQFYEMDRAESLSSFQAAHALVQGIPWVNTISASAEGEAWYVDSCPTPNLSTEAIAAWREATMTDPVVGLFYSAAGVVMLDGSTSANEWVVESGSRDPGLVPYSKMPQLQRPDFVFNANDSYWSTHPDTPLEGFSPLHGEERTPRSPRTRMNAVTLTETGPGAASGSDFKFDLDELRVAALSNRGMIAELLRDQVVERCTGVGTVTIEIEPEPGMFEFVDVDISEACSLLSGWDRRLDVGSVGAVVWREFLGSFSDGALADRGFMFEIGFNPDKWIATPNTLAAPGDDSDRVLEALAEGVWRLEQAGVPLDAPLGQVQFTKKYSERLDYEDPTAERMFETIPIHGGGRKEGVTNLIIYSQLKSTLEPDLPRGEVLNTGTDLTDEGYVINYGTSFIMTTEFTDEGPEAFAFLTYSQSGDPESDNHTDQTRLFSGEAWRQVRFTEEDIANDPALEVEVVFGF